MKVELLVTLKAGKTIYLKGKIFNSELEKIPHDILREVSLNTGTVRELSNINSVEEPEQDSVPEKTVPPQNKKPKLKKVSLNKIKNMSKGI